MGAPRVGGFEYDWTVATEVVDGTPYALRTLVDFEATVTKLCDHVLRDGGSARWFEDRCPMFGTIWPSARALATSLAGRELRGRSLLELGCGLGLPSLVAARGGARVLATDQHPDALALLAENVARNGLEVAGSALDWRDGEAGTFDHVVASNVLYAGDMPARVAAAFGRFLAPGGTGWLADPGRPWLQEFDHACRARGLAVEVDAVDDIFLLTIRPSGDLGHAAVGELDLDLRADLEQVVHERAEDLAFDRLPVPVDHVERLLERVTEEAAEPDRGVLLRLVGDEQPHVGLADALPAGVGGVVLVEQPQRALEDGVLVEVPADANRRDRVARAAGHEGVPVARLVPRRARRGTRRTARRGPSGWS